MPVVRRVSLAKIAAEVGLSVSGVCRALKGDEEIPASTQARVRRVAARLGYRPDPSVSEAFRRVGRSRVGRYVETLAYLTFHEAPIDVAGTPYIRMLFDSARQHAESLGYELQEFWARAPGMTFPRLAGILRARGIRGCLIAPAPSDISGAGFPWGEFSCVALTYTLRDPVLHRVVPSNYQNVRLVVAQACDRGYRRLGLLMERATNLRTLHAYHAGYLLESELRGASCRFAPMLELPDLDRCDLVARWIKRHRLDAIISSHAEIKVRLERVAPDFAGKVCFFALGSGLVDKRVARIDQLPEEVGRAGLDLLRAMLDTGTTGVPDHPRTVMIPGRWIDPEA